MDYLEPMASEALRTPPPPAWVPDPNTVAGANLTAVIDSMHLDDYADLWRWSVEDRAGFWGMAIHRLGIVFETQPVEVMAGDDPEHAAWLPGARMNIVASCFTSPVDAPAVRYRRGGVIETMSYGQLRSLVARVVGGLAGSGFTAGDRIAIAMPMTVEAVAAYLGIVAAGGTVVSIADSFATDEIATRLELTGATTVVTSDRILRAGRELPMYEKVVAAGARQAIVVDTGGGVELRHQDVDWATFLGEANELDPVVAGPDDETNILFSSGTTGSPKAIPWTHLTPVKAATDGHFHQDIHRGDVVAWPTNLGWMMGPWLIYASLINGATIALHDDAPTGRDFGEFVQNAGVTVLGVVPSLVSAWRSSGCLDGLDWSRIRLFSSTGEASNAADMGWLMNVPGGRPVIEYCGGTEIGGGYLTGTVLHPAVPGAFSTPALGIDVRILDESGREHPEGELFLVPPAIGLTNRLLNGDHHKMYFEDAPSVAGLTLRRHGDHMRRLAGGYYQAHGRVDDTMNLGGIKVSSAEIERVVGAVPGIKEVAAVAADPAEGGPSRLFIFAVAEGEAVMEPADVLAAMQEEIRVHLNPLFKVEDVLLVEGLPRTASAKVMRRSLRALIDEAQ
jgi:acetyl-CoA synthetase